MRRGTVLKAYELEEPEIFFDQECFIESTNNKGHTVYFENLKDVYECEWLDEITISKELEEIGIKKKYQEFKEVKTMCEVCCDDRFKIIEKAKEDLLEKTNIDTREDEMKVLDSFLFRCWQMGWLDKYKNKGSVKHG